MTIKVKCLACAELIQSEAVICRFCGTPQSGETVGDTTKDSKASSRFDSQSPGSSGLELLKQPWVILTSSALVMLAVFGLDLFKAQDTTPNAVGGETSESEVVEDIQDGELQEAAESWVLKVPVDEILPDASGSVLTLRIYIANSGKEIQSLQGTIFAKTGDGSVYGPVDPTIASMLGLEGFCGDNFVDNYWNPGEETHWIHCIAVPPGSIVTGVFIADTPDGTPKAWTAVDYFFEGTNP